LNSDFVKLNNLMPLAQPTLVIAEQSNFRRSLCRQPVASVHQQLNMLATLGGASTYLLLGAKRFGKWQKRHFKSSSMCTENESACPSWKYQVPPLDAFFITLPDTKVSRVLGTEAAK
jgi:hypothetical protein